MTTDALSKEIILVTPRERVTHALALTSAFTSGIVGLGLLYTASPFALILGCASMMRDSIGHMIVEKECAQEKMKALMPLEKVWSPILCELSATAGIRNPVTILEALPGESPAAIALDKKSFIRLPQTNKNGLSRNYSHIISHEFGHLARGDAKTIMNFLILDSIYGGMKKVTALGSMAALAFGTWPAALALGSAAALFHLAGRPMRKIDKEPEVLDTQGKTPLSEMEAERIAFELTGLPLTVSIYTTQKEMVQHCAKIGAPLPSAFAHMPKAEPATRLHHAFNKICGLLCRPLTMKRPVFSSQSPLTPAFQLHQHAKPGSALHADILAEAADNDARIIRGREINKNPIAPTPLSPDLIKRIRIY